MNESKAEVRPQSQFHLGRVVLLLVPLVASVLLLGWGWGYYDVGNRVSRWRLPPLVQVTGRVYLNGQPLKGAQVFTQPVGLQCRGAMGVADDEGRFTLRTDVDGDFVEGAYAGEHRVTVLGIDPNSRPGPFKPPTITPPESEEFETTPLRIQVDRDPERNQVEFRLEHKVAAPKAGQGGGGQRPGSRPLGAGPPGKSKPR
jgi:hypothetical protein